MKTVLLGMNNPQSDDPYHALYPHPPGCAGHRLWLMLAVSDLKNPSPLEIKRTHYIVGFERMNLVHSKEWDRKEARRRAPEVRSALVGRRVIICGATVPKFLSVDWSGDWLTWKTETSPNGNTFEFCVIPHPSGRCREYNDTKMKFAVGSILREEYLRGMPETTTAAVQ